MWIAPKVAATVKLCGSMWIAPNVGTTVKLCGSMRIAPDAGTAVKLCGSKRRPLREPPSNFVAAGRVNWKIRKMGPEHRGGKVKRGDQTKYPKCL